MSCRRTALEHQRRATLPAWRAWGPGQGNAHSAQVGCSAYTTVMLDPCSTRNPQMNIPASQSSH